MSSPRQANIGQGEQDHYRARVLLLAVPTLPRDGLPGRVLWQIVLLQPNWGHGNLKPTRLN